MSSEPHAMTIRLGPLTREELATVARIDELTIAEVLRRAIEAHIADRKADPEFRERLRAHIEREEQMLSGQPRQETRA